MATSVPDGLLRRLEPQVFDDFHAQDDLGLIALVEEVAGDDDLVGKVHQRRFARHGQADARAFFVAIADNNAFDMRIGIGHAHARQLFESGNRRIVQGRPLLAAVIVAFDLDVVQKGQGPERRLYLPLHAQGQPDHGDQGAGGEGHAQRRERHP